MKSYSELLRDPRWQKKRLQKLEAAEWMCFECESTDKTLNVHHVRYIKGRKPWEYENDQLQVLCEECHGIEHKRRDEIANITDLLGTRAVLGLLAGYLYGTDPAEYASLTAVLDGEDPLAGLFEFRSGWMTAACGMLSKEDAIKVVEFAWAARKASQSANPVLGFRKPNA